MREGGDQLEQKCLGMIGARIRQEFAMRVEISLSVEVRSMKTFVLVGTNELTIRFEA